MPSQRRKPTFSTSESVGRQKLRELRRATGLSLVDLAARLEADFGQHLDARHINRIETGSIKKPLAETLKTILAGLHARYRDRQTVLEAFGYTVPMTLPTGEEINETVQLTAYELGEATHPILLVDLGQRLCAWNRYIPRMIGLSPDDHATTQFAGATLLDVTFNPALGTSRLITNSDAFLPLVLYYIKASLYPHRQEAWCHALITEARTLPGFSAMWDSLPDEVPERFISRRIVPLNVQIGDFGVLQFRMSTVEFEVDPRFHIIHFTPFGATTLRACAVWAEAEGVL